MKRSPLRRRTPLRHTGWMRHGKPASVNRRTGWRAGGQQSAEWFRSRQWTLDRAHGRCEVRVSPDCTGRAEHVHHILMRSQGGTHDIGNLLAVCHRCHGHIHANPAESYEAGWLHRRNGT